MKILFDQGTPVPLRKYLAEHSVDTTFEQSWPDLKNGELLNKAEKNGYQLLITTDQNLRYQQNLSGRKFPIIVLMSTSWPRIQLRIDDIRSVIEEITSGEYREILI